MTYKIRTVNDLLKVPADRRLDCLAEIAEGLVEIERICAEHRAKLPKWLHWMVVPRIRQFEWLDDGRKDQTITSFGMVLHQKTQP